MNFDTLFDNHITNHNNFAKLGLWGFGFLPIFKPRAPPAREAGGGALGILMGGNEIEIFL